MEIRPSSAAIWETSAVDRASVAAGNTVKAAAESGKDELRDAFQSFVGQTLFGQMLTAMRKTVDKPAYFHGGQAEEMFRQQLDQVLAEKMADASADKYAGAMYELFTLRRN